MANPGVDDLAKRLFEGLPESMRTLQHDLENNFRAILQSGLARLELTTRTEFELQSRVLERTRARLEQLELRVATLEQRLKEFEESLPPVSD
jgi:hypothetical protein